MNLKTIETGHFKLDGGAMHGVVPKSLWSKLNPADDNNLCSWAMRCLLIEKENQLILIDTGIGEKQDAKFLSHYYLHGDDSMKKSIESAGYSLDEVTDVFLTHLHFDHVGGAVKREQDQLLPTFKNATYWTHEKHWEWAVHPNAREKASFLKENIIPLQESGQLKMLAGNEFNNWEQTFQIGLVNGHTEAMMLPIIQYKGHTILYCADLIPSIAHIPMPWVMSYDIRPLDTLKEKEYYLKMAVENNWLLYFEHDPNIELCSLQQTEKGIRWKETMKLSDL